MYPIRDFREGNQFNVNDVLPWFNAVDKDRSGLINAKELQAALVNAQGKNFSDKACNLLIELFDKEKKRAINIGQFQVLYNYVNQWIAMFRNLDKDQSGSIEEHELAQAMTQMGYRLSPEFIKFLMTKSDPDNPQFMSIDQFIVVCVQIQRLTGAFRERDTDMKGTISIGFEDFLNVALSCST